MLSDDGTGSHVVAGKPLGDEFKTSDGSFEKLAARLQLFSCTRLSRHRRSLAAGEFMLYKQGCGQVWRLGGRSAWCFRTMRQLTVSEARYWKLVPVVFAVNDMLPASDGAISEPLL